MWVCGRAQDSVVLLNSVQVMAILVVRTHTAEWQWSDLNALEPDLGVAKTYCEALGVFQYLSCF